MTGMDIEKQFDKPLNAKICEQINRVFTPYIFYERTERDPAAGYKGFCTYCRKEFNVSFGEICTDGYTLIHRDKARCPLCGHEGTLFHKNRGKKTLTEWRKVVIFRKTDNNHVYAQGFYVWKAYCGAEYRDLNTLFHSSDWIPDPPIGFSESSRYFFTPGNVRMWKMYWDYVYHESISWGEEKNPVKEPFGVGFGFGSRDYFFVNEEILDSTFLKYSCCKEYCEDRQSWGQAMKYLSFYTQYPCCEMMMKLGLSDFVLDAVDCKKMHKRYINWNGRTPTEIFKGISKQEFRDMCRYKMKAGEYIQFKNMNKNGMKIDLSECCEICRKYAYEAGTLFDMIAKYKISAIKAENYIKKFENPKEKNSAPAVIRIWKDYLDTAGRLGYDLEDKQVYMPKDLPAAHDTAVSTLNRMKADIEEKEMRKLTEKLTKQYSFEYGDMMIVVPRSMQEIISEGKALSHCVGGYAERHAKGQTIILFLRKKSAPLLPWFTIEIGTERKNGKPYIRQCHGYKNERCGSKPKEVIEFEKEFGIFIKDPKKYIKDHKENRRKTA